MRHLFTITCCVAGIAAAAACASLSGLSGDDPAGVPDGGAADATPLPDSAIADPCVHARVPAPPAVDDDPSGDLGTIVAAIRGLSIVGTLDGGAPVGLDIDGVCTCTTGPGAAREGTVSCNQPDGSLPSCDDDGGIDRRLGALLAAYPAFIGGAADTGGPTQLVAIRRYNGRANDKMVFVASVPSPGIYDATGCGDSGTTGSGPPFPPTWQGCDRWAVDKNFVLPGTTEPSQFVAGYVVDHVLVIPPSGRTITLAGIGAVLPLATAQLSARLVAVDERLNPIVPPPAVGTRFRLDEGVLAARVATSDALRAFASNQAATDGGPFCGFPAFFKSVKDQFLCPNADITSQPSLDFTGTSCDALSLGGSFEAWPAAIGEARDVAKSRCDDPNDPKYNALLSCP